MSILNPVAADRQRSAAEALATYAGGLLLVAVATLAGVLIEARWGSSPVDMLYLLPVLAAAIYGGLGPGLVAAAASALSFNYFFTAPYRTLIIHSPADVVTVIVLFAVAAVCSQLAASVRSQARLAAAHAARNATIAGFARRLLSTRDEAEVAAIGAAEIAQLFDCHVAVLGGAGEMKALAAVPADTVHSPGDLAAAAFTLETGERSGRGEKRASQADWQFHPVSANDTILAAVGVAREDGAGPIGPERQLLFENLLSQLALALERTRLEQDARDTAALRARDRMRSALLTSIGDDIKPGLKSIQATCRMLRRSGGEGRELAASLETEIGRLDRYVDNLVELNPGAEDEALAFGEVSLDLHRRVVTRDGEPAHLTPKEFALLAELAKHAGRVLTHAQLLRAVWGPAQQDHVDYLRVGIRALRQKLERDPAHPELIVNEPGVGYRLVPR